MPKEKTTIAKLKRGSMHFEVIINPEKAVAYNQGRASIEDALYTDTIYHDAKKGTRASEHDMHQLFGTSDPHEVAKIILKEGHVPQTEDMIKTQIDQRKRQLIDLIHRSVIDPNTGRPHPPQRIETAMNDAKVRVDPNQIPERQLHDVVQQLRVHLPMKFETRELFIRIPVKYVGRTLSHIKQATKVLKESWDNDGSLLATVEVPAGIQEELEAMLNSTTKGEAEIKTLGAK
ncbi:MAG TPA: ribosome assembly factor SBDS [Candidatus Nanoarchaeia archaeon]|nr:ribosome assembly factor SBDS [Candidatus Nanoarchaeia archaeon]